VWSTGSLGLDLALGVGGCRAAGSSRSTAGILRQDTLTLQVIAEVQGRGGGTAAFIDAENALDVTYAWQARRLKTEDLLISQPDTGEQALEIADMLVRSARSM